MALTPSKMIPLDTFAPDFYLPDAITGRSFALSDVAGTIGTVIMFICNHCPFVKHIQSELVKLANDYGTLNNDGTKEVGFVAISSNDIVGYPDDSPEQMRSVALNLKYPFPFLYDETQEIAKSYGAVCTPDFFVFDNSLRLAYRGQLDDSRPDNQIPLSGKDIRSVLDHLIAGTPVPPDQKPSIGCNIKWK